MDKKAFNLFCLFFVNMKEYCFSLVLKSARDCSATVHPTKETDKKKKSKRTLKCLDVPLSQCSPK